MFNLTDLSLTSNSLLLSLGGVPLSLLVDHLVRDISNVRSDSGHTFFLCLFLSCWLFLVGSDVKSLKLLPLDLRCDWLCALTEKVDRLAAFLKELWSVVTYLGDEGMFL